MKKILSAFCVIFISAFFSGCQSTLTVPGEKAVQKKNVYSEYYIIAEEYIKLNNYSKAIEYYKLAMGDKSLKDAAYYKMGRTYSLNGEHDKALDVFNKLLKKDPDNINLKSSVAYLTAMKGESKKAAVLYKNLVLENPDNSDILVNYISILIQIKDFETASINLEFLKTKFPDVKQIKSLTDELDKQKTVDSEKTDESADENKEIKN